MWDLCENLLGNLFSSEQFICIVESRAARTHKRSSRNIQMNIQWQKGSVKACKDININGQGEILSINQVKRVNHYHDVNNGNFPQLSTNPYWTPNAWLSKAFNENDENISTTHNNDRRVMWRAKPYWMSFLNHFIFVAAAGSQSFPTFPQSQFNSTWKKCVHSRQRQILLTKSYRSYFFVCFNYVSILFKFFLVQPAGGFGNFISYSIFGVSITTNKIYYEKKKTRKRFMF
jgi:hypothetical protein